MILPGRRWGVFLACLYGALASAAPDRVVSLETRPGVTVTSYYMPRDDATATLLLLTGGSGSIGLKDGIPTSRNFLVRSREHFAKAGFNVFIMGRPSDIADLDPAFRSSEVHGNDLARVVDYLRETAGKPVWLVGTSRGTISAATGAIALGDRIAGMVLTSSVTSFRIPGAPARQKLEAVRIPTLILHHARDTCKACAPFETTWIADRLTNVPVKKVLIVEGGQGAEGDPCEALHHHGYIGMEAEAVTAITRWINQPVP